MDDGYIYFGENRVSVSAPLVTVVLVLALVWGGFSLASELKYSHESYSYSSVTPTPPIQLPTLMPTQPVPPRATVYAAQPQVVNDGNGNVSIVNNYTYINQDVDVCVALVCE